MEYLKNGMLTNREVEKLALCANYKIINKVINTLPDLINYIKISGFKVQGYNDLVVTNEFQITDTGGLIYNDDNFIYTLSGYEILKLKLVQCTSCATLCHFMLKDNYEEVGYIILSGTNGGGHVLNYIKDNDKYYLINLLDYLENKASNNNSFNSLKELIDYLKINGAQYGCGSELRKIYTINPKGSFTSGGNIKGREPDYDIFPIGDKVISWLNTPFKYEMPKHNWLDDYYEIQYQELLNINTKL